MRILLAGSVIVTLGGSPALGQVCAVSQAQQPPSCQLDPTGPACGPPMAVVDAQSWRDARRALVRAQEAVVQEKTVALKVAIAEVTSSKRRDAVAAMNQSLSEAQATLDQARLCLRQAERYTSALETAVIEAKLWHHRLSAEAFGGFAAGDPKQWGIALGYGYRPTPRAEVELGPMLRRLGGLGAADLAHPTDPRNFLGGRVRLLLGRSLQAVVGTSLAGAKDGPFVFGPEFGINIRPFPDLDCTTTTWVTGLGLSMEPLVSFTGPTRTTVLFNLTLGIGAGFRRGDTVIDPEHRCGGASAHPARGADGASHPKEVAQALAAKPPAAKASAPKAGAPAATPSGQGSAKPPPQKPANPK